MNEYANGESQRRVILGVGNSRKAWRLSKRLTSAQLATLRAFFEARRGGLEPFYFYDPWDTSPKFTPDPTGAATTGRYTVCFRGAWSQALRTGRLDVPDLELIELA
jgi:hypothetical protein